MTEFIKHFTLEGIINEFKRLDEEKVGEWH
jgi:hypothetical protein